MATPIKDTPVLKGKSVHAFLDKLVAAPLKISSKELENRKSQFNKLESIRKF